MIVRINDDIKKNNCCYFQRILFFWVYFVFLLKWILTLHIVPIIWRLFVDGFLKRVQYNIFGLVLFIPFYYLYFIFFTKKKQCDCSHQLIFLIFFNACLSNFRLLVVKYWTKKIDNYLIIIFFSWKSDSWNSNSQINISFINAPLRHITILCSSNG